MGTHLTERVVKAAEIGTRKYVVFDEDCAGFGLCVFLSGRKGFILIYRAAGRQRRMTIGTWPSWSVVAAREEAKRLKRDIDRGEDPMDVRTNARHAPIMKDLIERFIDEHLPKLAATNAKDQICMLNGLVLPEWRTRKVADITPTDVDRLLTKIAVGRPRPSKTSPKAKRRTPLKPAKLNAMQNELAPGAGDDILDQRAGKPQSAIVIDPAARLNRAGLKRGRDLRQAKIFKQLQNKVMNARHLIMGQRLIPPTHHAGRDRR